MRRIAPTLPVPTKMFRHFAVITILITACIALFADGERRDAIGAEIDAQKQKTAMANAESGSLGPNKKRGKVVYYSQNSGGDSGAVAGDPMVNPEGANQLVVDNGSIRAARNYDFGLADYYDRGTAGPPGLNELRQGKKSGLRTGNSGKRSGGGGKSASRGPSDAQRNAIDEEGFRRAGPPTPPQT